MFVGKFYSLDLVNVIVFRVNNIYMVIMFFWRSVIKLIIQERSEGGFSESKLSLLWYLVGRERDRERERERERERVCYGRDEDLIC